jgi:hypothetical protein
MKKLLRLATILCVSVLAVTGTSLVAQGQTAWKPTTPPGAAMPENGVATQGRYIMHIAEQANLNSSSGSYMLDITQNQLRTKDNFFVCLDPGPRLDCGTGKPGSYMARALLPACGAVVESCIEKVWIYKSGEAAVEATPVRTTQGLKTKGYPALGIPRGDGVTIWSSGLSHSGGSGNYVVSATLSAQTTSSGQVNISEFNVKVLPVQEVSVSGAIIPEFTICRGPQDNRGDNVGDCLNNGNFDGNTTCAYTQTGVCGEVQEFAEGTRVAVQLRLHNEVSGWFHGRVKSPNLQVSRIDSRYNRVRIDALPGAVSRFLTESRGDLGDLDPTKILQHGFGGQFLLVDSTQQSAFTMLETYRNRASDTAAGVSNLWSISSMPAQSVSYTGSQCLTDTSRVLGVVTTNATAYSGAAPVFKNGFLNYEVAGMHYLPGGTELSQGSYDLVMRSDVARCLYGFDRAPLSAKVSVVNDQGTKTFATTVVNEKNGWLRMAAYGFTFSEKTIKVKITKAKKKKR